MSCGTDLYQTYESETEWNWFARNQQSVSMKSMHGYDESASYDILSSKFIPTHDSSHCLFCLMCHSDKDLSDTYSVCIFVISTWTIKFWKRFKCNEFGLGKCWKERQNSNDLNCVEGFKDFRAGEWPFWPIYLSHRSFIFFRRKNNKLEYIISRLSLPRNHLKR